jgi:signal transduction histidine kinase
MTTLKSNRRAISPAAAARRAQLRENVLSCLVSAVACFLTLHIGFGVAAHMENQRAAEAAQTELLRQILESQSAN